MSSSVPPPSSRPKVLPRRLGRHMLFDRIGKGGMAEIYLARSSTELGGTRLSVVKVILPDLSSNASFASLLVKEAKLAARLSHANVVQVLELGKEGDELFIAMEYVEGFDLNELLRRCSKTKTPLPLEFALYIVCEALRGLDYAHRRLDDEGNPIGLVHRDVSPSNVLISFEGEVKVCDFGIAHANEASGPVREHTIQGKAGYMSPEHARGEALDARADVFAAGVVLWELLSGRRFYKAQEGQSPLELARKAHYEDPPTRGLPAEERLHGVVRKALARSRDERFASAQTMLRELEAYMAEGGLLASQIKLGSWLRERFGEEMLIERRGRERAMKALELGPPVVLTPIGHRASQPPPAPAAESKESVVAAPVDAKGVAEERREAPAESVLAPSLEGMALSGQAPPPSTSGASSRGWLVAVAVVVIVVVVLAKVLS